MHKNDSSSSTPVPIIKSSFIKQDDVIAVQRERQERQSEPLLVGEVLTKPPPGYVQVTRAWVADVQLQSGP